MPCLFWPDCLASGRGTAQRAHRIDDAAVPGEPSSNREATLEFQDRSRPAHCLRAARRDPTEGENPRDWDPGGTCVTSRALLVVGACRPGRAATPPERGLLTRSRVFDEAVLRRGNAGHEYLPPRSKRRPNTTVAPDLLCEVAPEPRARGDRPPDHSEEAGSKPFTTRSAG